MDALLESPSWLFSSLMVVIPSVLLTLLALVLVRKYFPHQDLQKSHDVVGFTFSIVGVLYSVILGFTVVSVQERYNKVSETVHTEAITIADLYRDAGIFQVNERKFIRQSLRDYVQHVLHVEWGLPPEQNFQAQTQNIMERIRESYYNVNFYNDKVQFWYNVSIEKLNNFGDARLTRQMSAKEQLGTMMWALLITGALITICFMFFFGMESVRSQFLMTGLLSGYLAFMLYLVFALDHVYKGPEGIQPTAFEQLIPLFDRWDQDSLS